MGAGWGHCCCAPRGSAGPAFCPLPAQQGLLQGPASAQLHSGIGLSSYCSRDKICTRLQRGAERSPQHPSTGRESHPAEDVAQAWASGCRNDSVSSSQQSRAWGSSTEHTAAPPGFWQLPAKGNSLPLQSNCIHKHQGGRSFPCRLAQQPLCLPSRAVQELELTQASIRAGGGMLSSQIANQASHGSRLGNEIGKHREKRQQASRVQPG